MDAANLATRGNPTVAVLRDYVALRSDLPKIYLVGTGLLVSSLARTRRIVLTQLHEWLQVLERWWLLLSVINTWQWAVPVAVDWAEGLSILFEFTFNQLVLLKLLLRDLLRCLVSWVEWKHEAQLRRSFKWLAMVSLVLGRLSKPHFIASFRHWAEYFVVLSALKRIVLLCAQV